MGRINLKNKNMTDMNEAATADCPQLTITLGGTDADTTLATDIADWSDGATIAAKMTFGQAFFDEMATDTRVDFAFGTGLESDEADNGAYMLGLAWTWDGTNSEAGCNLLEGYYLPTAAVAAEGLYYGAADNIAIYELDVSDELVNPKYDWVADPVYTGTSDISAADESAT